MERPKINGMRKPKTIRGFLKMMLAVADFNIYELKGWDKLSEEEQLDVGGLLASIQNELGDELDEVLQRFNLKWEG